MAKENLGPVTAYGFARKNGFTGTEEEWLRSLVGKSAYEIAVINGYGGTEEEWNAIEKDFAKIPENVTVHFNQNS